MFESHRCQKCYRFIVKEPSDIEKTKTYLNGFFYGQKTLLYTD